MKSLLMNSVLVKTVFNLLLILCVTSNANSQIDSVNVAITFTTEVDSLNLDSLGNYGTIDVMNVNSSIYDVDFMGEVIVTVYQGGTDYPLAKIKMTAQQFIDGGLKSGSTVTSEIFGIDPTESYRIETQVRNYQGGNLPMVITNYNI